MKGEEKHFASTELGICSYSALQVFRSDGAKGGFVMAEKTGLRDSQPATDRETRWGLIYLAVVLFTVLVIGALWLFSRAFSS